MQRVTLTAAAGLAGALLAFAPSARAATGDITTVAGTDYGFSGDGGPATAAQLKAPAGVTVTPDGGYLIADSSNHRIRKVSAAGVISTVAGNGGTGQSGDGGPAIAAEIDTPFATAVTTSGGYLISDTLNTRIRQVAADGTISTVAGTTFGFGGDGGLATAAQFTHVAGIDTTADGGYLITDSGNNRIRKVSAGGIVTTVAGSATGGYSGDGGAADLAQILVPNGVASTPDGGYLIADTGNSRVRRVSPGGTITTVAGTAGAGYSGDGGPATAAQLSSPRAAVPTPDGGILIADTGNDTVRRVAPDGTISTVAGTGTSGLSGDGGPATAAQLEGPVDIALLPDGSYLIADLGNQRIRKIEGPAETEMLPPAPSNEFGFGKLKRNKEKGTASLIVEVPGAGSLSLSGKGLKKAARTAGAAGEVKLPVKAKGKKGTKLNQAGKVKVKAEVTFTPTAGTANSKTRAVKLRKRTG